VVQGRAVQVDPIKPLLNTPGTKRLKLKCDVLLSTAAFKFNLRRYMKEVDVVRAAMVGRCRLTVSKPMLKARLVSALENKIWMKRFQTLLSNPTCATMPWWTTSRSAPEVRPARY